MAPPSIQPPGVFPVTAGAYLLLTKQVCGYCIPSLSGTEGMCVWPGLGEGTLNKQPWSQSVPRLTASYPPHPQTDAARWTV